jgi:SpoVK/Ycf46/Vps4 family AAA+-type ATPase
MTNKLNKISYLGVNDVKQIREISAYPEPLTNSYSENKKDNFINNLGLQETSASFGGLASGICKYALAKYIEENENDILFKVSVDDFKVGPLACEIQTDVNETKTAYHNGIIVFSNRIMKFFQNYDQFCVSCYCENKEDSKKMINNIKESMRKKNQYVGKCLFFNGGDITFRDEPSIDWEDVILEEKSKSEIKRNTVSFLLNEDMRKTGINQRGLIMYGPPGTGKTMMVKSLFKELSNKNITRIYATADSFPYPDVVENLFNFLEYTGTTILAFEDIDLISPERNEGSGRKVLGALLNNLDGIRNLKNPTVIVGTTNDIKILDEALSNRPCRFDRKIEIPLPDDLEKRKFYKLLVNCDVNDDVINLSSKFSGAHIKEAVNTAKMLSAETGEELTKCLGAACNIIRENFFPMQKQASLRLQNGLTKEEQYISLVPFLLNNEEGGFDLNSLMALTYSKEGEVTDKEASSLWNIWKKQNEKVKNNVLKVNGDLEKSILNSLETKSIVARNNDDTISLTDKGKKLLRSIILTSEKCTFDKNYSDPEYIIMSEVKKKIHGSKNSNKKCSSKKEELNSDYYYNQIKDIIN